MDRYKKFILTIIAVGIIGINIQLFKKDIVSNANAEVAGMNFFELRMDFDFKRAVISIVEDCKVIGSKIDCYAF
tara:strand:+ start:374 stop:595 length:222 start_codon:yes stop_codon:yes gene_type:complete